MDYAVSARRRLRCVLWFLEASISWCARNSLGSPRGGGEEIAGVTIAVRPRRQGSSEPQLSNHMHRCGQSRPAGASKVDGRLWPGGTRTAVSEARTRQRLPNNNPVESREVANAIPPAAGGRGNWTAQPQRGFRNIGGSLRNGPCHWAVLTQGLTDLWCPDRRATVWISRGR
jgi:hypothetical protein